MEEQKLEFEITLPSGIKMKAVRINGQSVKQLEGKRCWCQHPPENRISKIYAIAPKGGPIGYAINYCPSCGRTI